MEKLVKHFKAWVAALVIMGVINIITISIAIETILPREIWIAAVWLSAYFLGAIIGTIATMLGVKNYIKSHQGEQ